MPADALLPEAQGLRGPLGSLSEARFGIIWGAMGAARACYETALEYAKTRVQFDKPIGGFQLTQEKLVEHAARAQQGYAARAASRPHERRRLVAARARSASANSTTCAKPSTICREARTILGANGVTLEYPVIRHMNNLESVLTYEGTSEMHTLIIGKEVTGLDAFA